MVSRVSRHLSQPTVTLPGIDPARVTLTPCSAGPPGPGGWRLAGVLSGRQLGAGADSGTSAGAGPDVPLRGALGFRTGLAASAASATAWAAWVAAWSATRPSYSCSASTPIRTDSRPQ